MSQYEYKLLDFFGIWCFPCKSLKPILQEAIKEFSNIELVEVDVDENPDLARKYKVRSIPTLILINGEEVVGTLVGLKKLEEIKQFLTRP